VLQPRLQFGTPVCGFEKVGMQINQTERGLTQPLILKWYY
jgi:hypothetical protein